jgi:hypothetical protein
MDAKRFASFGVLRYKTDMKPMKEVLRGGLPFDEPHGIQDVAPTVAGIEYDRGDYRHGYSSV